MRAVVTRVTSASVTIDGKVNGAIGRGFLVLLGIGPNDTPAQAAKLADKVVGLRVFEDENEKMNLSILDVGGQILAVSQFTLLGDARSSRRPSFIQAARPETANPMYERLVKHWRDMGIHVETGKFGAHMEVSLINDGPVTMLLDSHKLF